MTSSTKGRGLPGFLRRSLRKDLDVDDDDDDDDSEEEKLTADSIFPDSNSGEKPTSASSLVNDLSHNTPHSARSLVGTTENEQSSQLGNSSHHHALDDGSLAASERSSKVLSDSWHEIAPPETSSSSEPLPAPRKSYRETQMERVMTAEMVNLVELRKLGWNGIPPNYRASAWKILLGYVPTNALRRTQTVARKRMEYKEAIRQHYEIDEDTRTLQEQEVLRQVLVDVPRTAPEVQLFRNDRIRRMLSRLLYIWAMRHPASSYVQGINDLATPLVVVFLADYCEGDHDGYETVLQGHIMNHITDEQLGEVEADVYWCLTNLLAGIQDHYTADQPGIQRMVARLEDLVQRIDASLCRHFQDMGIQFLQFSFKWMNCLLLREFSLKCVIRLWDTYLSDPDGFEAFHVYVCAAFLCQFSTELQEMSFDDLFGFMQAIPTGDWSDTEIEMLLSQAYVLSTLFGGSEAHLTNGNIPR